MIDEQVVEGRKVVGRRFLSDTVTTLEEDGLWKLIASILEYRTYDGVNWEEKKVSAMSIDKDMDSAYNTAVNSLMEQFSEALSLGNGSSMFKDE